MTMLTIGVALFALIHLFKTFARPVRAGIINRIGEGPYKGLFSLGLVASIAIIVWGWWRADTSSLYVPPSWGRHAAMLLMLIAFILLGAANRPTAIRRYIRHPMLTGVIVWGIGHLLANGEVRSTILFAGLAIWAAISIPAISAREGAWVKPQSPGATREIIGLVASVVVYAVVMLLHPYFAGQPVISMS